MTPDTHARTICMLALAIALPLAGCTSPTDDAKDPGTPASQAHTETLLIPAGQGLEYKVHMAKADGMAYEWSAMGPLYFDFHGEPDGAAPGEFTSHKVGDVDADADSFTAPFTGSHGWYWENQGDAAVSVTITTSGQYVMIGRL